MIEYTQAENMQALLHTLGLDDMDEFNSYVENLEIQDITCGTYNGASDTFTPWDITESNIHEAVKQFMNETEFEYYNRDYLIDTLAETGEYEPTQSDYETLFFNTYYIYAIKDTKQVFIKRV